MACERRDDRGQAHHRADRQVDAAGDDDEGHADADDADDRGLTEDDERVVEAREAVAGGHRADDHEQHERQHEPEVATDGAGHHLLQAGLLRCGARGCRRAAVPRTRRRRHPKCRHRSARSCGGSFHDEIEHTVLIDLGGGEGLDHTTVGDRRAPCRPGRALLRSRSRRSTTALPAADEATDEGVDLGAGADVDAAGRLVQQQHARAVHEPARQQDLLLIAAREGARGPVGVRRAAARALRSARRRRGAPRAHRGIRPWRSG